MIVVTSNLETKSKYPYLGVNKKGLVVLFTKDSTGVVVRKDNDQIGEYSTGWNEDSFELYRYSITLKNIF